MKSTRPKNVHFILFHHLQKKNKHSSTKLSQLKFLQECEAEGATVGRGVWKHKQQCRTIIRAPSLLQNKNMFSATGYLFPSEVVKLSIWFSSPGAFFFLGHMVWQWIHAFALRSNTFRMPTLLRPCSIRRLIVYSLLSLLDFRASQNQVLLPSSLTAFCLIFWFSHFTILVLRTLTDVVSLFSLFSFPLSTLLCKNTFGARGSVGLTFARRIVNPCRGAQNPC